MKGFGGYLSKATQAEKNNYDAQLKQEATTLINLFSFVQNKLVIDKGYFKAFTENNENAFVNTVFEIREVALNYYLEEMSKSVKMI